MLLPSKRSVIRNTRPYSQWTPADLTNTVIQWHRSDSGVYSDSGTTAITDGGSVQQWNDLSGNGHHLVASISGKRPLYALNDVLANNWPSITFNGLSHTLKAGPFTAIADPVHIFAIYNPVTWTFNKYPWSSSDDTLKNAIQMAPNDANKRTRLYSGANGPTSANLSPVEDAFSIIEALYNGASSTLIVNDDAAATGNPGAGNFVGLRIGSSSTAGGFCNVSFAEVIAIQGEVTGDDLTNLRAYFENRYRVTTT